MNNLFKIVVLFVQSGLGKKNFKVFVMAPVSQFLNVLSLHVHIPFFMTKKASYVMLHGLCQVTKKENSKFRKKYIPHIVQVVLS